jgi:hypothetical protein
MNWQRRLRRRLLLPVVCGVAASALCWGFLYTKSLHHFSVIMLGPAWEFVNHHDPNCGASLRCSLEVLVVNAALYAFWIVIALVSLDVLSLLKRKLVH